MNDNPRLGFFDVDPEKFSAMMDELLEKGTIEMSHPDPLYDIDNAYDEDTYYDDDCYVDDDSMDGDFDTAMRDAGFGTDEDYGYYGEDY
jgi:hypothetical protein